MAILTFSGLPSGIVKTSMDGVTYTEATSPITLVDGMYIFVSGYYQLIGKPATYLTNVHVDNKDSDIWSTSKDNPFILTYGGALSYSTSSTSTENINYYAKYVEQPQTTLDLSTLSDIADGAHTVKVKAKANGYNDSEFSNEVSYTKAPAGQKITTLSIDDQASSIDSWDIYIKFDGVASPTNYDARFKNKPSSGYHDNIYYNGVWSADYTDVTVDITATQWSAYVAEQEYTNYVWPCANDSSFFKTVSPSTNGNLYPIGRDNNKFIVKQPAD